MQSAAGEKPPSRLPRSSCCRWRLASWRARGPGRSRLVVHRRAHGGHGRRPRHRSRDARVLRHHLGRDDGGDDVPVDRADGADVRGTSARPAREGDAGGVGRAPAFVGGYLLLWGAAGPRGLCRAEARAPARRRLLRLGQRRPLDGGGRARGRRGLRVHAVEVRLPAALPEPARLPRRGVARRPGRRATDGRRTRRLVPRLLLAADGGAVRARRDERGVDGGHRGADRGGEAPALARRGHRRRGRDPGRAGDRRAGGSGARAGSDRAVGGEGMGSASMGHERPRCTTRA